ncbi:uracil phosphoribosyltransferase [[Mycoplasma] testudinis]|uniref:uracil phosphoribosyltransferase n=1 Tax=[Mycoplasma] testudinis TaxID=33924 RepID=UPI00048686E3
MNTIIDHPLIKDKLTRMRDIKTKANFFRDLLKEITALMMYEIGKNYPTKKIKIITPLCETTGYALKNDLVLVPILRAGLGMAEGVSHVVPGAKIGHIGLYRNEESLQPVEYYAKFPKNTKAADVIVLDPMLATGGSASKAISIIKKLKPKSIQFVGLVGAPEGLKVLNKNHPDVNVFLAALDPKLNELGYILPGLGDAGDRLYGTK